MWPNPQAYFLCSDAYEEELKNASKSKQIPCGKLFHLAGMKFDLPM